MAAACRAHPREDLDATPSLRQPARGLRRGTGVHSEGAVSGYEFLEMLGHKLEHLSKILPGANKASIGLQETEPRSPLAQCSKTCSRCCWCRCSSKFPCIQMIKILTAIVSLVICFTVAYTVGRFRQKHLSGPRSRKRTRSTEVLSRHLGIGVEEMS